MIEDWYWYAALLGDFGMCWMLVVLNFVMVADYWCGGNFCLGCACLLCLFSFYGGACGCEWFARVQVLCLQGVVFVWGLGWLGRLSFVTF